jgi:NAD(P)-dependent dehydrogenase (short-subunit alcohol dehydrogenase family)
MRGIDGGMTSQTASEDQTAAIVIGASGGIGAALSDMLASQGKIVHRLSRSSNSPIDLLDPDSIAAAIASVVNGPPITHAIIATGILHDVMPNGAQIGPEKALRELKADWMARQFTTNTIGPALVLSQLLPQLPRDMPVRVAALGARVGSISDNRLGGWYGYRASKAALHQIIRTAAIEWQRTHEQGVLVALHPGTVATRLSAPFTRATGNDALLSPAQSATALLNVLDGLTSSASGRIFDWKGDEIAP